MKRRTFFASILGSAAVAVAEPVAAPKLVILPPAMCLDGEGPEGPVGMPGCSGMGQTHEEYMVAYNQAIAHNERYYASRNLKHP